MSKSTYPDSDEVQRAIHDPARLEVMRDTGVLRTAPEEAFDALTREASRVLGAPLALLTLVDEYSDFVKSHVGLPEPYASAQEITDGPSFCQLTIAQAEPLAINDTRDVPMLQILPSVASMGVRAHLGVPLVVDGQAIGNCCVIDFKPRQWSRADIATLTRLATEAMRLISESKASQPNVVNGLT